MMSIHCGLHLLVNFAKRAEKGTSETSSETDKDQNEAVKFVRMACKCFVWGGDEKNGIFKDLNTNLQRNKNPNNGRTFSFYTL